MPSLGMRGAALVVRMLRGPKRTAERLRDSYGRRTYPPPARLTRALLATADVREERVGDHLVYIATPKQGATDRHIIYTHGGGFAHAITKHHWNLVAELVRTGATVAVPIYPLAPEHQHDETHALLDQLYRATLEHTAAEHIIFAGDSAGGNLALVQAVRCRELGLAMPGQLVL